MMTMMMVMIPLQLLLFLEEMKTLMMTKIMITILFR